MGQLTISVVIATRDRPQLLQRVTEQVAAQLQPGDELIVVDDSTNPSEGRRPTPQQILLRSNGQGPAIARNLGWRRARGDVIAFTDDDVALDHRWLEAIRDTFAAEPELVAVEGRTASRAFDPLYEYSVSSEAARNGLTCNVAYTAAALRTLGGFDERFPFAHCEDVDLFTRASRLGPVRFSRLINVEHEPREVSVTALASRARWLSSERRLYTKHPELKNHPLPPLLCSLYEYIRWPLATLVVSAVSNGPSPSKRLVRAMAITLLWWWNVLTLLPSLIGGSYP